MTLFALYFVHILFDLSLQFILKFLDKILDFFIVIEFTDVHISYFLKTFLNTILEFSKFNIYYNRYISI